MYTLSAGLHFLSGSLNFDGLITSHNFKNIQHNLVPKVPET